MTELLESAGIVVIPCDFGTRMFSGIGSWTGDGVYLIFINSKMPGDRMRFTLAHEAGHIIMHPLTSETMEEEANAFASEFLMPAETIRPQLGRLTLDKLAQLKLYWKTSMSSILLRAKTLGAVTERQSEYLWTQMGKLGYRLNEPNEYNIAQENPALLKEIIMTHLQELGFGIDELAVLLKIHESELRSIYDMKSTVHGKIPPKLRIISRA